MQLRSGQHTQSLSRLYCLPILLCPRPQQGMLTLLEACRRGETNGGACLILAERSSHGRIQARIGTCQRRAGSLRPLHRTALLWTPSAWCGTSSLPQHAACSTALLHSASPDCSDRELQDLSGPCVRESIEHASGSDAADDLSHIMHGHAMQPRCLQHSPGGRQLTRMSTLHSCSSWCAVAQHEVCHGTHVAPVSHKDVSHLRPQVILNIDHCDYLSLKENRRFVYKNNGKDDGSRWDCKEVNP